MSGFTLEEIAAVQAEHAPIVTHCRTCFLRHPCPPREMADAYAETLAERGKMIEALRASVTVCELLEAVPAPKPPTKVEAERDKLKAEIERAKAAHDPDEEGHCQMCVWWLHVERERLEAVNAELLAALRGIADHPHQRYDHPENKGMHSVQYGIGCADGHRCAAGGARAAIGAIAKKAESA